MHETIIRTRVGIYSIKLFVWDDLEKINKEIIKIANIEIISSNIFGNVSKILKKNMLLSNDTTYFLNIFDTSFL